MANKYNLKILFFYKKFLKDNITKILSQKKKNSSWKMENN